MSKSQGSISSSRIGQEEEGRNDSERVTVGPSALVTKEKKSFPEVMPAGGDGISGLLEFDLGD